MPIPTLPDQQQISALREFNRFYTARLGLLRRKHLDGDFSLTEARLLYEIGARPGLTASSLRNTLGLNAGYLSRTLALLTKRKLLRQSPSKLDAREKLLSLSPTGRSAVAQLNKQSSLHIQGLLANLAPADRDNLLVSLANVRSLLAEPAQPNIRIVRLTKSTPAALQLLRQYYEAVSVVQRDTPAAIQKIIADPTSGVWLAYLDAVPVGCVVLRKLASIPFAGECKRLYVQPLARGHHIAGKLLDALEDFARTKGLRWIYLDSYDDLKIAIALYRKRGYVPCKRFNDNPQATLFLRKTLA